MHHHVRKPKKLGILSVKTCTAISNAHADLYPHHKGSSID